MRTVCVRCCLCVTCDNDGVHRTTQAPLVFAIQCENQLNDVQSVCNVYTAPRYCCLQNLAQLDIRQSANTNQPNNAAFQACTTRRTTTKTHIYIPKSACCALSTDLKHRIGSSLKTSAWCMPCRTHQYAILQYCSNGVHVHARHTRVFTLDCCDSDNNEPSW